MMENRGRRGAVIVLPSLRQAGALAVLLAVVLGGAAAVTGTLAIPWAVGGASMAPALRPGDRVIIDLWSYRQREPRPGEIALLAGPDGAPMIKRVGARVGGGYLVLGDNRGDSTDSRRFGPVPVERFRGRVVWRYRPLSRAGPVR